MKFIGIVLLTVLTAAAICAQRPRAVDTTKAIDKTPPPAAPQTMKAKYEGGIFGASKTMEGTLTFDDANQRLLFRKDKIELFVPYSAVNSTFADTQKRQPKAATIASAVPLIYALPAHFIKTKVRYLTLQFDDPDTHVSGVTSFRLASKELVESAAYTLANKAGLEPRGEIYVRKKDAEAKKTGP